MSRQASAYAREICETTPALTIGARAVLMLAAERANAHTAITYTGGWLVRAAGMHRSSVRRCLYQLAELGVVALERRAGRASQIRFPLAGALSTPGAPRAMSDVDDLARGRALPGASARATRRVDARRTSYNHVTTAAQLDQWRCPCGGELCDGTGWHHVDDGARGYVVPCHGRAALNGAVR